MPLQTTFFDWARKQGLRDRLPELLGYSERHLARLENGEYEITESFQGRVILKLGQEYPEVRYLFFDAVSVGPRE